MGWRHKTLREAAFPLAGTTLRADAEGFITAPGHDVLPDAVVAVFRRHANYTLVQGDGPVLPGLHLEVDGAPVSLSRAALVCDGVRLPWPDDGAVSKALASAKATATEPEAATPDDGDPEGDDSDDDEVTGSAETDDGPEKDSEPKDDKTDEPKPKGRTKRRKRSGK